MNDFVRLIYFGLLKNDQELLNKGISRSVDGLKCQVNLICFNGRAEYKVFIHNKQISWEYNRNLTPIYTLGSYRVEYI